MSSDKLKRVFTEGTLIQINVSRWSGLKYLDAEDLGLKREDIDAELFSLGRKRLMSKERMQRFKTLENRARKAVDSYSFSFPLGKASFVPAAALPKVIAEVDEAVVAFTSETEKLVADYEDIKAAMLTQYREALPKIYERLSSGDEDSDAVEGYSEFTSRLLGKIEAAYPADIGARYSLSYSLYRVELPADARIEAIESDVAAEVASERARLLAEKNEEMRNRINEDVDDFVVKVVGALRSEVAEVCGRVSDLIGRGTTLKEGSLDSLRELIEKFKTLNFMGDEEIDANIEGVTALLAGRSSADFRIDEALLADLGSSLKRASSAARRRVELSEIVDTFGGAGRRLLREED